MMTSNGGRIGFEVYKQENLIPYLPHIGGMPTGNIDKAGLKNS